MKAIRRRRRRMLTVVLSAASCILAALGPAVLAGASFTSSFSGGGHAGSADCSMDSSIGVVGGLATTGLVSFATGGLLPVTATNLLVTVSPPVISEGSTSQLSGIARLDDGTVSVLDGGDIDWGSVTYPLGWVNAAGVLTATNVYVIAGGMVTAAYLGAYTNLCVTVLDTDPDNYGIYAADQVPDGGQVQYFGTNNPLGIGGATNCTGQINLYTYTADLDPTNPASVLVVNAISNRSTDRVVCFRTTSTGRVYQLLYATNLISGVWTNLPGQTPVSGLAGQMSLADTNEAPVRFYRIQVQVP